jgi:hypothetical protein
LEVKDINDNAPVIESLVLAPAVRSAQGGNDILLEENNSSYGFEMLNARGTHILKSALIK